MVNVTYVRKILIIVFLFSISLVSAKSYAAAAGGTCPPTQNDVEGPYYLAGAPFRTLLAAPDEPGERIVVKGRVLRNDCKTPVKDALIEVWQTDSRGKYHYEKEGYRLRGQMRADRNGNYEFITVKPGRYQIMKGFRPAHIHLKVSHPGYDTLITQLYFKGDPYLWPNDACGRGCRSNDPHRIIPLQPGKEEGKKILEGRFTIILRPSGQ